MQGLERGVENSVYLWYLDRLKLKYELLYLMT